MNEDINYNIKVFIDGIGQSSFKALKKSNKKTSDVIKDDNKNLFECAVYQGYLDMTITTNKDFSDEKKNDVLKYASNRLKKYFEPNYNNKFDNWHKQTVKQMKKTSGNYITVGQCQKIINMSFKYLYCCEDYRGDRKGLFVNCHMPLDSYTLEWYKDNCEIHEGYKNEKWSKIDDYDEYFKIIKDIRKYVRESDGDMTVLEKEFVIWNAIKGDKTINEFKKCIKTMKDLNVSKKEIFKIFEENMKG